MGVASVKKFWYIDTEMIIFKSLRWLFFLIYNHVYIYHLSRLTTKSTCSYLQLHDQLLILMAG